MKGRKRSSVFTGALLVLAIAALLFGGIGSARAVLTPSDEYIADIGTKDIALVLNENGDEIDEGGALLSGLIAEGDSVKVGQMYDESLTVKNTGQIDQYVRVSVYKYWTEDGKRTDLDPALIKLETGKGWVEDKSASTPERTVLYCTDKVAVGDEKLVESGEKRGMVIDFSDLKSAVRALAKDFDHTLIYEKGSLKPSTVDSLKSEGFSLKEVPFRPTAENFARHFYKALAEKLPVRRVTVYETPDNCAEYEED